MNTNTFPLPLHASRFLETLKPDSDLNQCQAALRKLLPLPARISRARRVLLLGGALALPMVAAAFAFGLSTFKREILNASPDLATLNECLTHYHQLQREDKSRHDHSGDIEAFEIYIAGRFLVDSPPHGAQQVTLPEGPSVPRTYVQTGTNADGTFQTAAMIPGVDCNPSANPAGQDLNQNGLLESPLAPSASRKFYRARWSAQ